MTVAARPLPAYQCAMLPGGRLHLNEGPIDLVIGAEGEAAAIRAAFTKAADRFDGLLSELAAELPALRSPVNNTGPVLHGVVAQRMLAAVRPHRATFITPMAAVAGAVADEILTAMASTPGLAKAYVNNGGDIAVHLIPGECLTIGAIARLVVPDGIVKLVGGDDIGGVATSGAGGRSLSLGVADSVTVLAQNAAMADAAATLIGNAVNVDHAAVKRAPANSLDPDSDLGDRLVTVHVGKLPDTAVSIALRGGVVLTQSMLERNLISGALLCCQDKYRVVGPLNKFLKAD
jgi:ApbE superfamily uncharacterized protein (UPF0280 family)